MTGLDFEFACVECGGALRGTAPDGACPGCGKGVGETLDVRLIDSASGMVHEDVACVACRYNLRTLRGDANCPECFTPVIRSLRPDDLRLAAPRWLARMRSGITCLIVGSVGFLAIPIAFCLLVILAMPALMGAAELIVLGVGFFICWIIYVVGVFRANTAEPAGRSQTPSRGLRTSARLTALASILGFAGTAPLSIWLAGMTLFPWMGPIMLMAAFFLTLIHLRRLVRRARRPGLARLTSVLLWMMALCGVTVVGLSVVAWMSYQKALASTPGGAGGPLGALGYAGTPPPTTAPASRSVTVTVSTFGSASPATTLPTTTAPVVMVPPITPAFFMLTMAAGCVNSLLMLACYVVGLVALFKYRAMFTAALRRSLTPLGVTE